MTQAACHRRPLPVLLAGVLGLAVGGQLAARDATALREAVERTGGVLRTDASGQPVEVDWTAGRGTADVTALELVLACPTMRTLRGRGSIPADQLVRIGSHAGLRELALHDAALADDDLARLIEPLGELQRLTIRNAPQVTDRAVGPLARCASLTHLTLLELSITDAVLPALAALPRLVSLDLRHCSQVTARGLRSLRVAAALRELKIGGQGIDDMALAAVAEVPHLVSLTVEDSSIRPAGLADLIGAPGVAERLHAVSLARCLAINDAALESLARLPQLKQLGLRDMPVTGMFLQALPAPERLETLALNQTFLTDEAFASIAACRNLKRLELAQNPLGGDALLAIGTLSKLEYLNLSECGLDDAAPAALAGLTRLKTLVVDGNPALSTEARNELRRRE